MSQPWHDVFVPRTRSWRWLCVVASCTSLSFFCFDSFSSAKLAVSATAKKRPTQPLCIECVLVAELVEGLCLRESTRSG